jgi:hypothetical protein
MEFIIVSSVNVLTFILKNCSGVLLIVSHIFWELNPHYKPHVFLCILLRFPTPRVFLTNFDLVFIPLTFPFPSHVWESMPMSAPLPNNTMLISVF